MRFARVDHCGEVVVSSAYQSSNQMADAHISQEPPPEWETRFVSHLMQRDVPRPGFYKGYPILYGGLAPKGIPERGREDQQVIFSPSFGYKLVDMDSIRMPTDAEYFRLFEPLYSSGKLKLEDSCIRLRRTRFLSFNDPRFNNFKKSTIM